MFTTTPHRRSLVGLFVSLSILIPAAHVLAARHTEAGWTAHPPIHIKSHDASAPVGYAPAQIRHAYGFDRTDATGSRQVVGIVDAYDAPTVAQDLQIFIRQFQLTPMNGLPGASPCTVLGGPHPCFQVLYAAGKKPKADEGWSLETALDTQWAHAAAPGADILLVEAQSASITALTSAVDASVKNGARVVSMSWGGPEFQTEKNYDSHFHKPGVSFLASSGDDGTGQSYPAGSPYVLSVGGTTLPLSSAGTPVKSEKGWQGSGGGISAYEKQPGYQSSIAISTSGMRAGPDVAYDADPATGFAVYSSFSAKEAGWFAVGGTSAASPQWAGIVAMIDEKRSQPLSTSTANVCFAYTAASVAGNYRDIKSGKNGTCGANCKAAAGYDLVTGLGSPVVSSIVPYLASH